MKRLLAILFLTIYISTAFGTAINFHYCGKRLANVSLLNFGASGGCACNPSNKPMDCCENDLLYQKADNHETVQPVLTPEIAPLFTAASLFIHFEVRVKKCTRSEIISDFFRRCCPEPIYLLNRVFRI